VGANEASLDTKNPTVKGRVVKGGGHFVEFANIIHTLLGQELVLVYISKVSKLRSKLVPKVRNER
jgi:hypothetical protein